MEAVRIHASIDTELSQVARMALVILAKLNAAHYGRLMQLEDDKLGELGY